MNHKPDIGTTVKLTKTEQKGKVVAHLCKPAGRSLIQLEKDDFEVISDFVLENTIEKIEFEIK